MFWARCADNNAWPRVSYSPLVWPDSRFQLSNRFQDFGTQIPTKSVKSMQQTWHKIHLLDWPPTPTPTPPSIGAILFFRITRRMELLEVGLLPDIEKDISPCFVSLESGTDWDQGLPMQLARSWIRLCWCKAPNGGICSTFSRNSARWRALISGKCNVHLIPYFSFWREMAEAEQMKPKPKLWSRDTWSDPLANTAHQQRCSSGPIKDIILISSKFMKVARKRVSIDLVFLVTRESGNADDTVETRTMWCPRNPIGWIPQKDKWLRPVLIAPALLKGNLHAAHEGESTGFLFGLVSSDWSIPYTKRCIGFGCFVFSTSNLNLKDEGTLSELQPTVIENILCQGTGFTHCMRSQRASVEPGQNTQLFARVQFAHLEQMIWKKLAKQETSRFTFVLFWHLWVQYQYHTKDWTEFQVQQIQNIRNQSSRDLIPSDTIREDTSFLKGTKYLPVPWSWRVTRHWYIRESLEPFSVQTGCTGSRSSCTCACMVHSVCT